MKFATGGKSAMRHITVPLINYNLIGNANNSVEIRVIEEDCSFRRAVEAELAMLRDAVKVQVLCIRLKTDWEFTLASISVDTTWPSRFCSAGSFSSSSF